MKKCKEEIVYIDASQQSSRGVKAHNDDACSMMIPTNNQLYNKGVVAVIADGVSTSEGGAEASQAAVQGFIADYYSTPDSWSVSHSASKIYSALNRWLLGHGQRLFLNKGGAVTTFSALIIKSSTAYIFHVGDSRIYHWRDGTLEQITHDHRIPGHGGKEYLGRALGINAHIEVDAHRLELEEGDCFLLCTDGVHDFLTNSELEKIIGLSDSIIENDSAEIGKTELDKRSQLIIDSALDRGSDDNLSCQILRIKQLPEESTLSRYQRIQQLPFPPELAPELVIDNLKILREIYASAKTQLYLALDLSAKDEGDEGTDKRVVLKTPSVNYEDDSNYLEQFQYEEWVGSRISSPHTLKIIDVKKRRQFLYYVTEYIEGITLRQWMKEHPKPSLEEVRKIIEQVISGLRALHRMEMVHRDIKPENIMIDHHGTVKIIDYGSVRIAGVEERHSLLNHNLVQGTYDYSAPEIIGGSRGSTYSDQFSLGVLTYELLSGKLPYGSFGDRPSTKKVLNKIQHSGFTALHHQREDLPIWVGQALQKALDPSPKSRYPALSEFYQDLMQANPQFLLDSYKPLLERDPLLFWRGASLVLALLNIALLIYFNHF